MVRYSRRLIGKSLQPFTPAFLTCTGRGELLNLRNLDQSGKQLLIGAEEKILGMYVNELLVRLVPRGLGSQSLFGCYEETIRHLASAAAEPEVALRLFELKLLELSGFVIPLEWDCKTDEPLLPERCYYHEPGKGFSACDGSVAVAAKDVFSGQTLLALRGGLQENSPEVMREAKRLLHGILDEKFRKRPLRVREIMKKLYSLRNAK